MNKQREVIYSQRRAILEGASLKEEVVEKTRLILDNMFSGVFSAKARFPRRNCGNWPI
jgi:preprotein translocase subunit SecA